MKCVIVEDDLSYSLELEQLISSTGVDVIGQANDYESAVLEITEQQPDIVISDVCLPNERKGIDLLSKFAHLDTFFLFLTSFPSNDDILATDPDDRCQYIIKPVQRETLLEVLDKVSQQERKRHSHKSDDYILVRKQNAYHKLPIESIVYIEAQGDHSVIHTRKKKYINKISLQKTAEMLKQDMFMKIHRSYVVNLLEIETIYPSEYRIKIKDVKLPFSRSKKSSVLNSFKRID